MCAKCTLPIDLPKDSHLCQACTDERDLKEIDGLIDSEKREVDCLVVQMADCDILRAQYERDQPYSELAESTKKQLLEMKRSELLSRGELNDLKERKKAIKQRMSGQTATLEASTCTSKVPITTLPPVIPKTTVKVGLGKKRKP